MTEREYIDAVKAELRYSPIRIEVIAGDPNTAREIVDAAVAMMRSSREEAKRNRDASLAFDEVWAVFDAGEHPYEQEARIQARDNGIEIAASAPCFELWILLHQCDQTAFLRADRALGLCHGHELMRDKHITGPAALYRERYQSARDRSRSLRAARERGGNPGGNPSTDFDLLIDSIRRAKERWAPKATK